MASEPAAGQQKKLHPLFAALKASEFQGHSGTTAGVEGAAGGAGPEPKSDAGPERQTPTAEAERQTNAPAQQPVCLQRPEAAEPKKRKPDGGPADDGASTAHAQTQTPRRRGRPSKKRKSSPVLSGIASLFVRHNAVREEPTAASSSVSTDDDETALPTTVPSADAADAEDQSTAMTAAPTHQNQSQNGILPSPPSFALDPSLADAAASTDEACPPAGDKPASSRPPMRVLQLNPKTGTIGSPPRQKDAGKKAAVGGPKATVVVVVRFGQEEGPERARIGARISDVLAGRARIFPLPPSPPAKTGQMQAGASPSAAGKDKDGPPKKRGRPKKPTTHPFFTGGLQKTTPIVAAASAEPSSTPTSSAKVSQMVTSTAAAVKYFSSMPCSPKRRQAGGFSGFGGSATQSGFRMPQFGVKNGVLRVPGARLPQWPWKDTVHVHPPEPVAAAAEKAPLPPSARPLAFLPQRKRKGQTVQIEAGESVLERTVQRLRLRQVADEVRLNANSADGASDGLLPPPPARLRLPQKHLLSGRKVQAWVAPRLRTSHAGVTGLFGTLETALSAFDQHQCETQSWTQKYAPTCAAEVLQSGREPQILRDWLAALKVVTAVAVSTEGGGATGEESLSASSFAASYSTAGKTTAAKKKRKKSSKLDGFIVSSDEEDDDNSVATGDGLDGEAADWLASGLYGLQKKTVVREGGEGGGGGAPPGRLANGMVLSGPHGCGKTAAVYAAAKELGFEVFEINASSRRSGKDVIDRIGDMTRNHLLHHRQKQREEGSAVDGTAAAVEDSKDAGKQSKMSAFFQPKTAKPAKLIGDATTASKKGQNQSQGQSQKKQSLILLEEADLLYEEDRQFWTTVMGLMAQSRRPFVITCNDETLLPLANLRLHGILRLGAAPTAPAVDRLLLAAASEGHVLRREAVEALYEAREQDLRAALSELQFWCQLGVGDRRGGFDWFVQRWPEGVDRDEEQQVVRVVSEDTYVTGMGWVDGGGSGSEGEGEEEDVGNGLKEDLSDDLSDDIGRATRCETEEELVQQAWRDWQLDMGQWQDSLDLREWAAGWDRPGREGSKGGGDGGGGDSGDAEERRRMLEACSRFADAMSDADAVSLGALATGTEVQLDATVPELSARAREDFMLGRQLLAQPTVAAHAGGSISGGGGSSGGGGDDFGMRLPVTTALRCAAKQRLRAELEAIGAAGGWRLTKDRLECVDEAQVVAAIRRDRRDGREGSNKERLLPPLLQLQRIDFALAFDPIATPVSACHGDSPAPAAHLDPSVFDRNMEPIVADVAPFVRGIVAHEGRRRQQRQRLSRFLTEDAQREGREDLPRPKRMRTTRAALSALEGGPRSAMRRERWFLADINPLLVARTAGDGWTEAAQADMLQQAKAAVAGEAVPVVAVETAASLSRPPKLSVTGSAAEGDIDFDFARERPSRGTGRRIVMSSPRREEELCAKGRDG